VIQVLLGVEAWMGKFAAAGPYATQMPMERPVTTLMASIRTGHVVIGTALLASTVVFALRAVRQPHGTESDSAIYPFHGESAVRLGEPVSMS
jgi:hypothetical protein